MDEIRPDPGDSTKPSIELENSRAADRRKSMAIDRPEGQGDAQWALCLSGGGIRSATFCLGVMQGLARSPMPDAQAKPLLQQFDFLSTVSGGGYVGVFFSSLFVKNRLDGKVDGKGHESREGVGPSAPEDAPANIEAANRAYKSLLDEPPGRMHSDTEYDPAHPGKAALAWLRDNGRYMTPTGSGDFLYAAAIGIRNWFAMHYVIATVTLLLLSISLLFRLTITQFTYDSGLGAYLFSGSDAVIWWSATWLLAIALLIFWTVPCGIAFWFTHPGPAEKLSSLPRVLTSAFCWATAIGLSAVGLGCAGKYTASPEVGEIWAWTLLVVGGLVLAGLLHFLLSAKIYPPPSITAHRVRLTRWLSASLKVTLVFCALALIETLAQTLTQTRAYHSLVPAGGLMAVAVWLIRFVAQQFSDKSSSGVLKNIPFDALAGVLGVVLWITVAVVCDISLLWIAANGNPADQQLFVIKMADWWKVPAGMVAVLFVIAAVSGLFPGFLNLSTFQGLYSARITRTYLGASNHRRFAKGSVKTRSVAEPVTGDSMDISTLYANPLAPIHYINVCMNQTVGPDAQLVQRDRKGKPMTVAPGGFYLDGKAHPFPGLKSAGKALGEVSSPLSAGEWIGVSGAAFTTGLGRSTRLGYSLLLGFANVRLGRWWPSGVTKNEGWFRKIFHTQTYLTEEIRGVFHGTARTYQYLSDGGHFENTASYEMLRPERKVSFMVMCDCGADPDYRFDDLANLIRLARIDHGIEIKINRDVLATGHPLNKYVGAPEDFQRLADGSLPPSSNRCAVLLDVHSRATDALPDTSLTARILLIKPSLISDSAADVRNYQARHPSFPQEPTADQFFDEAQWESYRKLGLETVQKLFPTGSNSGYAKIFWDSVLVPPAGTA